MISSFSFNPRSLVNKFNLFLHSVCSDIVGTGVGSNEGIALGSNVGFGVGRDVRVFVARKGESVGEPDG